MKIFIPTAFARAGGWLVRARRARAAMTLLLLLVTTTTARAQGSVSYRVYNASTNQFEDGVAASTTAVTEETTAMSDGWYVVSGNVNVSGRIEVTDIVNLILCDGATLTATQGLHVPTGVTLNIYGQSDGSGGLTATQGGSDQAGIGGNNGEVSGTITIHGGNVTSTGGWSGAGIGGGHNQPCGSITIYGGTVNAHGGDRAAGIGGGTGEYSGGTITIMGGTVTAWANTYSDYDNSQAIGVGMSNNPGTSTLFLGDVKVYNSSSATTPVALTDRESTCRSKYVRLTTCDHHYVNNECTYCGAEQNFIPIPYLVYDTESECFVQHTANVATYVKATTTTMGVAGSETFYVVKNDVTVSSRLEVLGTVHLILCDGKTLTATGGITVHTGNTLNIHGQEGGTGAIVATSSGGNNAAIGTLAAHYNPGTINSNCGTINFHGGTITATGGAWSAAIGGGVNDGGGAINIYGGHISASATNPSQGNQQAFGQGSSGSNVSLSIADGLRAYANNSSTPVAYNSRKSALHQKTAVVEPCTQHKQSGNTCTYCGIKIYSVTYDANNATSGTVPTDANIYYINNTVTILGNTGNLERSGYFFAGWNTKADGSGVSYSEGATFTISDNTTLYAMWMPLLELAANADNSNAISAAAANGKQHRVVLDGYTLYRDGTWNTLVLPFNLANLSGTPLEGLTVKTLESSTLINGELTLNFANANSIEAGKPYIVKWDQAPISNLVNPVFEGVLISDATANVSTTYADFIGSYVPITGDSLLVDAHNPNGDAMHAAIRAKLEGYSVSYYTQPDINFPATTIPFSADGNVTLWTICIPIDYSITYNLNGGTNHPGNPATYNIESTTITLQEPSKTNYIFGGWFDNEDCTGDAVTTIAHGSHGNVTLYAKWLVENLELVANGDNSSAISEAAASGRYCNVTLADCTIYTEGSWNTLCLPFSLASLTGTPLEGLTVKTLESSTFSDGTLTMNFSDATSIEAGKPYIVKREADLVINSTTDWNTFAYNVMHEESYEGKLVRLGADITVNSTVGFDFDGGDSYAFKGTFDGCGHTLTINYTGQAVGPAPFMCAAGNYVIKNLIVAGTINTTENQAAGFVGNSYGNGTIRNCRSSVVIKSDYKGDAGEGGFVAMLNNSASLTMEDCVFDGKILTVGTNATTNCAGLVGYKHNGATLTMNNCLYAPAALTGSETAVSSGCATFARNASSFTNCYYTQTFGTAQGTNASGMSTAELLAALGSGWEIRDGQVFPKMNDNIVNPVFSNVLINTASANVETTYADFIGTYAPITDDGLLLDTHAPNGEAMHAAIRAKRESYTFEGWYSDAALTTPATAIPFATNGTVTIYTKWTPIEYSITYNLNGGTNHADNPATYNIESANITLQAPEKSGYNFGGWFENEDCTGDAVTNIALGSHGNVTLYAKWTPILVLANNIDNSSAISSAAASGKYHSVILTDRTIYRDGDWNTFVLPFNLATLTGTPLEGFMVKTLESSTYSDGTLTMNFSDATSIEAGKPYIVKDNADLIIRSVADWNTFAQNVNNGTDNYQGKVVKLVANISVTTMVGNSSHPFKGTFDGCGHTLNVSISGDNYTAPFSCVGAASIRNLKVDGSVTTTNGHPCGGLVGFINGALTITNCVSSVTFTSGYKGNAADGGILGLIDNNSGNVTIEDCAFMGKILTTNGTTDCGGIVGWRRPNGVTLTIKNCLYAPTALTVGETEPTSSCKTICRYSDPAPTITNCYYTRTLGDSQGTDASGMSNETLVSKLGSGWEISNDQVVPKMNHDIVNPVFEEVLTSNATANISTDHANFIGSYAPITDTDLLLDAHNPNGDAMHAALRLTLSEPIREGNTFGGWYTDNGFTTPLSTTIPFTANGNVTLYGKWTPITYTVRFNKNHEDASGTMDDQPFTYGTEQALTANAFTAPTGYMFAGWSTTTDGEVEYTDGQSVSNLAIVQDAVVNLYAIWVYAYTISYNLAGGSADNPTHYSKLSDAITLVNPTRTGYTFMGWTGTDLDEPTMSVTIPAGSTGNRSYSATWTPIAYSITYNLGGGTLPEGESNPTSYNIESEAITLVNPTLESCIFLGWTGTGLNAATMTVTIPTGSTGDREYTATWTGPQLVLSNNGDNSSAINAAVASGKNYDVTLTGRTIYKDGDWNTLVLPFNLATLTGTPLEGLTVKTLESTTFNDGTLTMNYSNATSIEAGKPYIVKDNADLVIRTAADWSTFANNVGNYQNKTVKLATDLNVSSMVGGTFNGTLDGCGHTITLSLSSGSTEQIALFNTLGNATIKNLKIAGTITFGKHRPASIASYISGTTTIKNCWSSVSITSNYNPSSADWVDGGAFVARVNSGTTLNMSDCLFTGSITYKSKNNQGGGMVGWTQGSNSTANLTHCLFSPSSMTMTVTDPKNKTYVFVSGEARGNLVECYYNSVANDVNSSVLKKEGSYTTATGSDLLALLGSGWEIRDGQVVPKMNPDIVNPVFKDVLISDATVNVSTTYADFIGSYAPITDDGLLLDTHNPNGDAMHAALSITLSEPTRDGYTFSNWCTDAGLITPLSSTIPFATNGNVTLYSKWTPITYTVRFNKNHEDASGTMDDQPFTYGTEQALTANVFTAPTGYMFAGWSTTIDGAVEYIDGQSVSNLATEQDAVVNLYAQWSEYCTLFAEGSTNQWMTWCDDDEWSVAAAPVKVYTVSGISGSTVTLTEENSGCIPANTPLLIRRTDNSTSAITVPLRTKGTTASTLFSAEATDYTFYGNPTDQTITTGDYFTANQSYVLYGDKFLLVDTDGGIAPHRCLLTLTSPAGARRLNIILDDGSLPSKVLSVESEEKTDDWYTIDGRKLSQQPTKKGLYIHNGKKTVNR